MMTAAGGVWSVTIGHLVRISDYGHHTVVVVRNSQISQNLVNMISEQY